MCIRDSGWSVCMSVCLSVTTITKKIVDGFVSNFMGRFLGGKGTPSSCFVTIGIGMWKWRSKNSVNRRLFTFYTSNSRCGKCCQVLATKPQNFAIGYSCGYPVNIPSMQIHKGTWLVDQHCGNGCSINHAPPLWWQFAIAFAGSCNVSEYFPSSFYLWFCFHHPIPP